MDESHNSSLLEYPQYTRPLIFKDMKVPDILVSGNHEEIKLWRKQKSLERTLERRKDLIFEQENNINYHSVRLKKNYYGLINLKQLMSMKIILIAIKN